MTLWRVRMRVVERPGRLAAVAAAFGRLRCDILALHIAPTGSSAITPAGCDALDEMVISVHPDRALLIRRPGLPFTPTEAARATALTAAARHARYSTS
jgi:predicted NAD/FAD-binding protein